MSIRIESNRPLRRFPRDLRISFVVKEHHRWEPWWAAAPLWKWEPAASSQEPVLLPPTFPPRVLNPLFSLHLCYLSSQKSDQAQKYLLFAPSLKVCPISTHDKKSSIWHFIFLPVCTSWRWYWNINFYWVTGWSKFSKLIFSLCTISTHCAGHYHIRLWVLHLGGVCPTQHSRWSPKKRPVA